MQIAQVLAGYSLGGADLLRRAMGKKKPEEMAKERAKFEAGASERNVDPRVASGIFDLMEKFAEYGFNKSHSAAYALVAYQTAWLKVHYPAQFMAATLSSDMDNTDKVVNFLNESRALGLAIAPPDVNSSGYAFTATDAKSIRYGLGAIKGVGHGACIAIVDARASGDAFRDLPDFLGRVDGNRLNRRVVEALIHAGALDSLGSNRPSLLAQLPDVLRATEQAARERAAGQVSLFGGGPEPALSIELAHCDDWPLAQKLTGERETLGHYLSGHPLDPRRSELNALVGYDLGDLERVLSQKRDRRGEAQVVVAGMVTAIRKRGETMAFVQIEDGKGRLECLFFRDAFIEYGAMLSRDRVLVIEGSLSDDDFSGGFSLRAKRCWDYRELCAGGQRLDLRIDLRGNASLEQLETTLNPYRPGKTPLRLHTTTTAGCGVIEINGVHSVRSEPELIDQLRALPAISEVSLLLPRPWQN